MINLTDPIFTDENAARAHFEAIRWPNGKRSCPHCGAVGESTELHGKSHRPGLYQCNGCREHFTVKVGGVMESSHIPLTKWAAGFQLYAASKKGFSAHQLHRMLGLTYKTAWFMAMRIREAMTPASPEPMGGGGQSVEADETFLGPATDVFMPAKRGRKAGWRKKTGTADKRKVLTLVERGGKARSFHIPDLKSDTLKSVIHETLKRDSHFVTDDFNAYRTIGLHFITHRTVNHSAGEYVRGGAKGAHTNTVEGFFSIFKRGMTGVYQHCSEQHLHRYLAEFDFRYSNRAVLEVDDTQRAAKAIKGAEGKRLTYQQPRAARVA